MPAVHRKDMAGGRQDHLVALGQQHCLQHIDELRDVCHDDGIAMVVEDVQVDRRHQGVPHRVLLVEEPGVGSRLDIVPGAPLVDAQTDGPALGKAADNAAVVFHQFLHPQRLVQRGVVGVAVKVGGAALVLPVRAGDGVVVQADGVDTLAGALHHGAGPVVVVHIGARGDLVGHKAGIVGAQIGRILAAEVGVVFGAHRAAAAPGLVADAPVPHTEGRFAAVAATQVRHRRDAGHIAVFHPVGELLHGAAAHIAGQVGFAAELFAEAEELVGAEGVVLGHAAPVGVDDGLALAAGADAVPPVVGIGKAAARPAQHRDVQRFQRLQDGGAQRAVLVSDTAVDAAAQMFGKLSVDRFADRARRACGVDNQIGHDGAPFSVGSSGWRTGPVQPAHRPPVCG